MRLGEGEVTLGGNSLGLTSSGDQREESVLEDSDPDRVHARKRRSRTLSQFAKALVPVLVGAHCFLTAALVLPGLASSSSGLFCGIGSSSGLCSQVFLTSDLDYCLLATAGGQVLRSALNPSGLHRVWNVRCCYPTLLRFEPRKWTVYSQLAKQWSWDPG